MLISRDTDMNHKICICFLLPIRSLWEQGVQDNVKDLEEKNWECSEQH